MEKLKIEDAVKATSQLLVGASLDSFRVFSTVLLIGFYRSDSGPGLPNEVWLSCSGRIIVNEKGTFTLNVNQDEDFFLQRVSVIGKLFKLIGSSVEAVAISPSGILSFEMDGVEIRCEPDKENFEEIWTVMSDSPDTSEDHRWYIALDDNGEVGGQIYFHD
jgi:hypothetical protein